MVLHINIFLSLASCKTVLVFQPCEEETDTFQDLGVRVVSGSRFLRRFVGEKSWAADFSLTKLRCGATVFSSFLMLLHVTVVEPQALFAVLARSLQFEWNHIHWVVPECGSLFALLQHAINTMFYSALFGVAVSE